MSPVHRRYLLIELGVGSAVFNLFINAVIAWVMYRGASLVPLWGSQSIAGDTAGTAFFLPFFTCLIVTRLSAGHVRKGRVPLFDFNRTSHPVLRMLPDTIIRRSVLFGFLGLALAAPPAVWALGGLGVESMPLATFIAFKAGFAAVLAFLVTPLIGMGAVADGGRG